MVYIKICFWLMLFTVFYAYFGYGILLFAITRIRRLLGFSNTTPSLPTPEPEVTLFIAAYNERETVAAKMENIYALDYPREKLRVMWITDGSDDGTPELLKEYQDVAVHHIPERSGKIGAMNRGMKFVKTPIVVFCDANTLLSPSSIRRITALFSDPKVGCVSGEKRIFSHDKDTAAGAGEGLYWKYESALKKMDAELYSVAGAAGELFAIRTRLYQEMEQDTLLDDFMISLRVAQQGYTIQYDPEAYAIEPPSASVKEELKRKIRISAGGLQSAFRLRSLLNIFKYRTLSFQYFSHRLLRWTLAPLFLLLLLPAGGILAWNEGINGFGLYSLLFWGQVIFYIAALAGWYLENRMTRVKILFVPYYFFIMNLSVFLGLQRLIRGTQSVNWARARRAGMMTAMLLLVLSGLSVKGENVIAEPQALCIDGTASPFNKARPGDTVFLRGGARPYLLLRNFTGTVEKPIIFINLDGPVTINTDWHYGIVLRNCLHTRLTGSGDPDYYYGIMITRVKNGAGLSIGEGSSYTEIDHVYIDSVSIAGIYAKTDPDCSLTYTRDKFTQRNTLIHDCYIAHTGDEGLYIGSSFYSGKTITCNGKDTTVFPHLMEGVRIYNNIVMYTGWDGIQVASASVDCQIFNNIVMYDSQSETNWQMSGILIGGGSQCDCYNNYIYKGKGDGIESLGLGDYRIFNNIIVDAGRSYQPSDPTKMKYGIYVNDNSARAGSSFSILFNDIINPKSNGIRFSSAVTSGNLIASNVIINPGLGSNAYIAVTTPSSEVQVKNNYFAQTSVGAGFMDTTFRLSPSSPLIDKASDDRRKIYFDYFYRPRPSGSKPDIGAHEYSAATGATGGWERDGDSTYRKSATGMFSVYPVPFPNPVTNHLTIAFAIDRSSDVDLTVYDMKGTAVHRESQKQLSAGEHLFRLDTSSLPEGVCLYSIRANGQTFNGKFFKAH